MKLPPIKRQQHHHTVALEHFQESKSSFSQVGWFGPFGITAHIWIIGHKNGLWWELLHLCETFPLHLLPFEIQLKVPLWISFFFLAPQHFFNHSSWRHSYSQILTNHSNEARGLQGSLREVRACRDNLARRLQSTEDQLQRTKAGLQHLQQLSQDHSLLEREELTIRLTWASAMLEDKDKRILVWRSRRVG